MYQGHFNLFKKQTAAQSSGNLYILSGPSGVGKTTIMNQLLKEIPKLEKIVAFTTRPMRPGEISGKSYHFISCEEFKTKIKSEDFLEYIIFNGNYYGFGLTKSQTLEKLNSGTDLVVDMDYHNVLTIKSMIPHCISIFIMPSSISELQARLIRRSDDPESIAKRMRFAQKSIDHSGGYDKIVINANDKLDTAVSDIKTIMLDHKNETIHQKLKYA